MTARLPNTLHGPHRPKPHLDVTAMPLTPHSPLLAALVALAGALPCMAVHADEGIVTDRPDFVESSAVVGAGRFQLETGLTSDRRSDAGTTTRTLTTPTLLRLGVGKTTELRIETDGLTRERTSDASGSATEHGFSDLSFGVKWHVLDNEGTTPGVAWLLHVDTASGSKAFRGAGLRPSLRAAVEWDLPEEFSVGVMPGLYVDRNDAGKRFAGGIFAVTLGKAWNDQWHSFAEIAGQQLATRANGGSVVTLDAGIAWAPTPDLQFDIELSRGVTRAAPDFESGVGVAIRF
jgi:hypothetical protein